MDAFDRVAGFCAGLMIIALSTLLVVACVKVIIFILS